MFDLISFSDVIRRIDCPCDEINESPLFGAATIYSYPYTEQCELCV